MRRGKREACSERPRPIAHGSKPERFAHTTPMQSSFRSPADPPDLDVFFNPQSIDQLAAMVLDMPDVIELKLQLAKGQPAKSRFRFQFQGDHSLIDLLTA